MIGGFAGGGGTLWERRIRRAEELAAVHPAAAEGLRYYARVAAFQQDLYESLGGDGGDGGGGGAKRARPPGSLREDLEPAAALPRFAPFLALIAEIAPFPLARSAADLNGEGLGRWAEVLGGFLDGDDDAALNPAEALLAWTFLQPFAERLAAGTEPPEPPEALATPALCPLCAGLPQVGVLRPQGDGGKRSLICSLCAHEWDFRRIVCSACGEEAVDKLPVYVAEELPHVRVEACDTCHCYLKTIDLTKDGRAVPVVDELAAIALSLWAAEKGYTKLCPNLLGL
jgi:FdhE protein